MVLPVLSLQLKHLKYLKDQPDNVSIEVCKLVVEFLSKNQNINRYTAIAEKMNTSKENLELTVQALTLLIIKSIQNNVTKTDFEQALFVIFSPGQTSLLWEFISGQRTFMANLLRCYNVTNMRYRDLEWRLEARIASRSLLSQAVPIIKIKLFVDDEQFDANKECIQKKATNELVSPPARSSTSRCKEILFQTDPTNLLHIIAVLEQALEESKTHRTKNLVKAIQM